MFTEETGIHKPENHNQAAAKLVRVLVCIQSTQILEHSPEAGIVAAFGSWIADIIIFKQK